MYLKTMPQSYQQRPYTLLGLAAAGALLCGKRNITPLTVSIFRDHIALTANTIALLVIDASSRWCFGAQRSFDLSLKFSPRTEQDQKRIEEAIEQIDGNEKSSVVGLALRICPCNSPKRVAKKIIEVLKTIERIPADQRVAVVDLTLDVSSLDSTVDEKIGIIKTILKICENQRKSVVNLAMQATPVDSTIDIKKEMIHTVWNIPAYRRESVVDLAMQISIPATPMGGRHRINYMRFIQRIPEENYMEFIHETPEGDRNSVVRLASQFISPRCNREDKANAMAMIRSFSAEQRASMSELADMSESKVLGISDLGMSRQNLHSIMTAICRASIQLLPDPVERALFVDTILCVFKDLIRDQIEKQHIFSIAYLIARAIPDHGLETLTALEGINDQMHADAIAVEIRVRLNQLLHRQHAQLGINVHEGNRDLATRQAVERLYKDQERLATGAIKNAKDEFVQYLDTLCSGDDIPQALRARHALLGERSEEEPFGPLIGGEKFSVVGLPVDGAQLVGRLWLFIQTLGSPEKENAKSGMVTALADSYEGDARVCNPGKVQRLVVAVLQGRLDGVNVEGISFSGDMPTLSIADAINLFFAKEEIRAIDNRGRLIQEAEQFLQNNPRIPRDDFIAEVERYCSISGM